jgi:type II secretory pathway pseudopilin PulG
MRTAPSQTCRIHPRRAHRTGFTLIEIIIATGLGLVMLLLVAQGFRYATLTILHARRMSVENGLLRGAYIAALEEADFWTLYDRPEGNDPTEPLTGGHGLRATIRRDQPNAQTYLLGKLERTLDSASVHGLAFTPLTAVNGLEQFIGSTRPLPNVFAPAAPTGDQELVRGWRKHEHWSAADPRTWYRGCVGQMANSDLRWGHYGLISHSRTNAQLGGSTNPAWQMTTVNGQQPVLIPAFGTVTPLHTWRENQILGLTAALGNFGVADYLPANAILSTHGAVTPTAAGVLEANDERVRGDFRNSSGSKIAAIARNLGSPLMARSMYGARRGNNNTLQDFDKIPLEDFADADGAVRTWFASGLNGPGTNVFGTSGPAVNFFSAMTLLKPLLLQKPAKWPDVYIGQRRYLAGGRFVCVADIHWASATSGLGGLSFGTFGTSLRGARQQRARPGSGTTGWAVFRGVSYDAATNRVSDLPGNDPTLDDQ